jgi:hypothetical protein
MKDNMKKRVGALALAMLLLLALTACGGRQGAGDGGEQDSVDGTAEIPAELPEAGEDSGETQSSDESVTLTPDEENTDHTADEPQVGQRPADPTKEPGSGTRPADPSQKPESKPVQKPSETPGQPAGVDLTAFYSTLAAGKDWPAQTALEGETMEAFYPGLAAVSAKQCGVYTATMSAAVGEIALVEVTDAADVQKVKDIFQSRIDDQVGDDQNPGGAWYPDTIAGWKDNSRIVSNGRYVMLVAMKGADDIVAGFHALFA